ncbi:(2Fe-2S)-binding protein [Zoogloea sp.]|uniref:(2Fe-2S)-binding protein n=1 Tax=Zoogloea sp. TaxID=49181 RepID=UPI0035B4C4E5
MYVCVCRAVTDKHIDRAVQEGATRLRDLRSLLGVTEECGRCAQCAKECLDDAKLRHCQPRPVSAPQPLHFARAA